MNQQSYSPPVESGAASVHTQPFNQSLSLRLDVIISQLDYETGSLRRQVLKLHKRMLEVNVPAWQPTQGGAR